MTLEQNKLYDIPAQPGLPEDLEAVSTNLSPELVLKAYPMGLFPWHQDELYFYWFSPDPRMVLFPEKVKISKSMRNVLNQNKFRISYNEAFSEVIQNCAKAERTNQDSTWITKEFINTYQELHKMGIALSVEAWNNDNKLVGGLYGLMINDVFFGESMFSMENNASKVCFIKLAQKLDKEEIAFMDCQAVNSHLKSLGAEEIKKDDFIKMLKTAFNRSA